MSKILHEAKEDAVATGATREITLDLAYGRYKIHQLILLVTGDPKNMTLQWRRSPRSDEYHLAGGVTMGVHVPLIAKNLEVEGAGELVGRGYCHEACTMYLKMTVERLY